MRTKPAKKLAVTKTKYTDAELKQIIDRLSGSEKLEFLLLLLRKHPWLGNSPAIAEIAELAREIKAVAHRVAQMERLLSDAKVIVRSMMNLSST